VAEHVKDWEGFNHANWREAIANKLSDWIDLSEQDKSSWSNLASAFETWVNNADDDSQVDEEEARFFQSTIASLERMAAHDTSTQSVSPKPRRSPKP